MKKLAVLTTVLVLCGLVMPAQAQEQVLPPTADRDLIVQNLLVGLTSDNAGLKRSCALMLGQIFADEAAIQLMFAMRNDDDPQVRIASAWALCRIGSEVGTYLMKHRIRLKVEENKIVRAHEAFYYDTYLNRNVFNIVEIQVPSISQIFHPIPVETL